MKIRFHNCNARYLSVTITNTNAIWDCNITIVIFNYCTSLCQANPPPSYINCASSISDDTSWHNLHANDYSHDLSQVSQGQQLNVYQICKYCYAIIHCWNYCVRKYLHKYMYTHIENGIQKGTLHIHTYTSTHVYTYTYICTHIYIITHISSLLQVNVI